MGPLEPLSWSFSRKAGKGSEAGEWTRMRSLLAEVMLVPWRVPLAMSLPPPTRSEEMELMVLPGLMD